MAYRTKSLPVQYIGYAAALLSRVGVVPAAAIVLGLAATISLHLSTPTAPNSMTRSASAPSLRSVAVPSLLSTETYTRLLGYRMADSDIERYRTAFALQSKAQWARADAVIAEISDETLMGALQAQRYLHEDYESRYDELASWLRYHADMPQAPRVHALARRKSPVSAQVPAVPPVRSSSIKGFGTRDGIGGHGMPPRFKDGLNAWKNGNYAQAATIFDGLTRTSTKDSRWNRATAHYWAWRAYDRLNNDVKADAHLKAAAAHPFTLYGLLAAHQLGDDSDYDRSLPQVENAMLELPAVRRAAWFSALGDMKSAEDEMRLLHARAPQSLHPQLLTICSELSLPGLQMRLAQELYRTSEEAGFAAFPAPSWVSSYELDGHEALIFAIARQESGFNPKAVNPDSGATGLLQLMPNTARYVIGQYRLNEREHTEDAADGMPLYSVARLNDPVVNMVIGQQYLNYLSEKDYIGDNLVHMLAAYNAGPGNLVEWQKNLGKVQDPLLFVEMIPFKETRHYVKQVLTNYMVYDQMIDGSSQQAAALSEGEWPRVQPAAPRYAARTTPATLARN